MSAFGIFEMLETSENVRQTEPQNKFFALSMQNQRICGTAKSETMSRLRTNGNEKNLKSITAIVEQTHRQQHFYLLACVWRFPLTFFASGAEFAVRAMRENKRFYSIAHSQQLDCFDDCSCRWRNKNNRKTKKKKSKSKSRRGKKCDRKKIYANRMNHVSIYGRKWLESLREWFRRANKWVIDDIFPMHSTSLTRKIIVLFSSAFVISM